MKLVVVESPYAGDVERNLEYLREAMADCLRRGEAPYASHALYTQPGVLDDTILAERKQGIEAGFAWGKKAALRAVYCDLGFSSGMVAGMKQAIDQRQPLAFRLIRVRDADHTIDVDMEGGPYAVPVNVEWIPPCPYEILRDQLTEVSQVVPVGTLKAWTRQQRDEARHWAKHPDTPKPNHLVGYEQLSIMGIDVKVDPTPAEGAAEFRDDEGEVLGQMLRITAAPNGPVHYLTMGGQETVCGIYAPDKAGVMTTLAKRDVTCLGCRGRARLG